jgi:GcrA cell cycle regulator
VVYCVFPNGNPGEPGFGFCDKLALPGRSYCAHHCAIAYIGHHERKRKLSEIEIEAAEALRRIMASPKRVRAYANEWESLLATDRRLDALENGQA